ncbi:MAG: Gfo/Idh/MocA family oxidoreductase [Planctomycetota bacterium]
MPKNVTRRGFLKTAAALAAAPCVLPASVLGADGAASPSERIVMAGIGIGGRGSSDLQSLMHFPDCQFVAVAEVRKERRDAVKGMIDGHYRNKDCQTYGDFREVLARKDIDAVLIATSDRWHTPLSVCAMRAGKDVYCEKPCSFSIAEGRILADTAREYGRVYQAGTQRRSEEPFAFVRQLSLLGFLGKVHTLTADIWGGIVRPGWVMPPQPEPAKDVLDWDMFLGPAPWRPYNHEYNHHGGKEDFHTGCIGEWGSHTIDTCGFWTGLDLTSPVEYEFPGNDDGGGMVMTYANGVKIVLKQGGFPNSCGVKIEGSEGWGFSADSCGAMWSPKSLGEKRKQLIQQYLAESQRVFHHWRDFLDCCKSRRPAVAPAESAHRAVTACHIGNISLKLKRSLKWDPAKEEFPGDEEANRLRARPSRPQWSV